MRTQLELPVVVAGAGLAAAVPAARAGARVVICESGAPGGRVRTQIRDGFRLNQGPHALYRGGPGRRVLARLGVPVTGHAPSLRRLRVLADGRPRRIPAKQATLIAAWVPAARPARWDGASAAEWVASLRLPDEAALLMAATIRLNTYACDLDQLPAALAISRGPAL